jgi:hypothetical protein
MELKKCSVDTSCNIGGGNIGVFDSAAVPVHCGSFPLI